MRNLYGVISCCVLLSLAVVLDNAHAKKPQKSAEVSAISLDVLRVKACAVGQGCSTVGGPKQWNLFDLAEGKTDFANQVLMPAKTHELRLMLGSKSTITVDGQTYSLTVPSGQVSGLKLKGNKVFASASGFLKSIRLNFDLAKGLVVTAKKVKGKGKKDKDTFVYSYSLKPVIQVSSAEVMPMPENMAGVFVMPNESSKLKLGNDFLLSIPVGAVSAPTLVTVEEIEESVYKLNPDGMQFLQPVQIDIKYDFDMNNLSEYQTGVFRDGTEYPSVTDGELNLITLYTLGLSVYAVGEIKETEESELDYTQQVISTFMPVKTLDGNQYAIQQIESNDNIDSILVDVEHNLKCYFKKMYNEITEIAQQNQFSMENVTISGCRTKKDAHRLSTGSNIYNNRIKIDDLREWAKKTGGMDINSNIWYKDEWEGYSLLLCAASNKYMLYYSYLKWYIKNNAMKSVPEIASGEYFKSVSYAEEGYKKGTDERRPNNDIIPVSTHVKKDGYCNAIDLGGLNTWWREYVKDDNEPWWSTKANDFVSSYHLFRPYNSSQPTTRNPYGQKEQWHYELSENAPICIDNDDGNDDNQDIEIVITNPESSDVWRSDEVKEIRWDSHNFPSQGDVKIEYSLDNGRTWMVIDDETSNDGKKQWYMCEYQTVDTDDAYIKITSLDYPNVVAISDEFEIDHAKECK